MPRATRTPIESRLGRLWAHEKASYGLRVLIALGVAMGGCWQAGELAALPAIFLGIIASAIAETDDHWLGRTKSVLLSLACFAGASAAVVWLFPHPWAFVIGLALSTFVLTLLGALGERYASVAQATVALAIYTMIGLDERRGSAGGPADAWQGTALLLLGAAWYGLLSILWSALFANRPVRERLAQLFEVLGEYLRRKADLFEPVRGDDLHARRLALAEQNARVVAALNAAKAAILSRFGRSGRPGVQSGLYFRLYYLAQDFHERASSSHYPYEALTEAFFHSDVLYRCRRLLALQGTGCAALGEALRLRRPFVHGADSRQATEDLRQSLDYLHARADPAHARLIGSLELLASNLQGIEQRLSESSLADTPLDDIDTRLRDSSPHTLKEMGRRLLQQLTPGSVLFRHGVRMAVALLAGYAVMTVMHAHNGFWILLTTAFVCRPNYGATRLRLVQRIAGTLVGLGATWTLMQLFTGVEVQLVLALLAALLFFVTRTDRYLLATAAITVMALLCFNLLGDGFLLLWPRLLDTLIGCAIAALASFLILPDWQGRRLHLVIANVLASASRYLRQVRVQYDDGPRDDLNYRIARRDMHNADAALSAALANMVREPGYVRRNLDAGFRFLALSNVLLGYLSALGAHRERLVLDAATRQAGDYVEQALASIASSLASREPLRPVDEPAEVAMAEALEDIASDAVPKQRLLRTQLALVLRLLPRLRAAAQDVASTRAVRAGAGTATPALQGED